MSGRRLRTTVLLASLTCGTAALGAAPAAGADRGVTSRVSVSSSGQQGNGVTGQYAVSADGRFVAFVSDASNLVPGDGNGDFDVFLRDRLAGRTRLVSVSTSGQQSNGGSFTPAISADGRFVVFQSSATNLVPGDTNDAPDVFIRDLLSGVTRRVSVSSSGEQARGQSFSGTISANGRFVAFTSDAPNLVRRDTNGAQDVFVWDRQVGLTRRISVSTFGEQSNSFSEESSISADGRYVAFDSAASNLVPGDPGPYANVFVRDRLAGVTRLVSTGTSARWANGSSFNPSISADGRFVAFDSLASNLVPGDTNGATDVFVHDRRVRDTERVSIGSSGRQADDFSDDPAISADGRFVAFRSFASNLVPSDTNAYSDVFVRDRRAGRTDLISVSTSGRQGNANSYGPAISADGGSVFFGSDATNLVPRDTNNVADVFARDPLFGG